ncbi:MULTISPECIES: hypothetical protein [unclassified Rathayibacter]|uniref:hypothetical protein n=1 Tax=unclassified Rathayibacter TaxID=2609250 RepID=UPI0006F70AFF|nr:MULTISPECIES: hypothetical protein [unclassified Rathayibacter]KQP97597.1 hypothetical protein ASF42_18160 [Rathayibacter sp. Leaf294]KQS07269.1 hypothetical protein ASG06_18895 [Rathayibacter sp. Leaf185]
MSQTLRHTTTIDARPAARTPAHRRRDALIDLACAVGVGVIALVAALIALRLSPADLGRRWTSGATGDMVAHYLVAAGAKDWTLFLPNPAMGFPGTQNQWFTPIFDFESIGVLSALSLVLRDPILLLNVFQLSGFVLAGIAGYYLFRALRVRRTIAVLLALVFALMPYHFERIALGHAFVGMYWGVALLGILILTVASPTLDPFAEWVSRATTPRRRVVRRALPLLALTFGLSISSSYYFVFGCIILGGIVALRAISALIRRSGWRDLVWPALTVLFLVAFVGAQLALLSLDFGERYASYFAERLPFQSEQHSGKITSLLLPWDGSGFGPLAELSRMYQQTTTVSPTAEPTGTPLIAAIAMILIVLFILVRLLAPLHASGATAENGVARFLDDERAKVLSAVYLWGLLFFVVGGLGYIFAAVVTGEIRAWVRLSVVLSTVALMFLAVLLDTVLRARLATLVTLIVLALVAGVDQLGGVSVGADLAPSDDAALRAAVSEAESEFAPGCGIVQLPLHGFPEAGAVGGMGDYDEALPYLFSSDDSTLRWSYGAVTGTRSADYWAEVTTAEQFGEAVDASGACGILVDQAAFGADTATWSAYVAAATSATTPVIQSEDDAHRYLFFRVG